MAAEHLPAVPDPAPREVSYELELDPVPEPGSGRAPVDLDYRDMVTRNRGDRQPVIPDHLRTVAGVRAAAAHHAGRQWHRTRYHGLRSPKYLLAALGWAVVGLFRLISCQLRWWWALEQHELRSRAAAAGDAKEWIKLHNEAKQTRKVRGIVLGLEAAGIVAAVIMLAQLQLQLWWAWALAAAVVVPLLARFGRPADRRIINPAVVTPRFRKLTADIVLRAYYAAGLGHPDKPGQKVTFGSAMARDGDGSRVLVDLPYGLGLDDAVKAKPKIASGLDVTESQVFIRRDPSSHRRHTLWVADRDPLAVPVGRTPLLACKPADIWKPAPLGLDERGQLVSLLLWTSVLVGALPRQGKTFAARLLALYCALDPFVQMDTFDGKGSPDWRKFALVSDSYAYGLTPTREGLPPEILLGTLERARTDVQDRYHQLSEMDPKICPEGKLTREIARDPRFGMPVRAIFIDEIQEYFDLGEISKDIASLLVFLVKVAPGAGYILVDATQKPSGIGTGAIAQQFTSFRDQHQVRFSLRTSSWQVSEMVLGQGAYSEGLDSSTLLPQYKGVGILRGASDASPTVRTYLADGQDAERILVAARALRERAGTLSGMAAGLGPDSQARDVLADVLGVFGAEPGLHWPVIAERLARRFPDRWAGASGVLMVVGGIVLLASMNFLLHALLVTLASVFAAVSTTAAVVIVRRRRRLRTVIPAPLEGRYRSAVTSVTVRSLPRPPEQGSDARRITAGQRQPMSRRATR
jgi:DNA segregation ATPase FtsK/SpoIIIE, S-DNA-T family